MNLPAPQFLQLVDAIEPVAEYVPATQDLQLPELD